MEVRATVGDWLQKCENTSVRIEVVDDKNDDASYLLEVKHESEEVYSQWLREKDINSLIKMLTRIKRERKRLVGK